MKVFAVVEGNWLRVEGYEVDAGPQPPKEVVGELVAKRVGKGRYYCRKCREELPEGEHVVLLFSYPEILGSRHDMANDVEH